MPISYVSYNWVSYNYLLVNWKLKLKYSRNSTYAACQFSNSILQAGSTSTMRLCFGWLGNHSLCDLTLNWLFYSIRFHSIRFHSIRFHSIRFHSILFYSILFYSILFYSILFYSILGIYTFFQIVYKIHGIRYYTVYKEWKQLLTLILLTMLTKFC
jgi:hypothetical protein